VRRSMIRWTKAGLAVLLVALFAAAASAEIYRWMDETGEVHLTNRLYEVPDEHQQAALDDAKKRAQESGGMNEIHEDHAAPTAPAATPSAPAEMAQPGGGRDETWWRSKSHQMQSELEQAKTALAQAQADEADDAGQIYGAPGRRGRGGAGPGRRGRGLGAAAVLSDGDYDPSVEELEAEVDRLEREYSDFEDEARHAEVPPGWLR